jgi:hypothetical protein
MEIRRVRRGNDPEHQRRHHSEVARARPSKRPEQVPLTGVVVMDQAISARPIWAPIRRNEVSPCFLPRIQPAAQRQPSHPYQWTSACGDGEAVLLERLIHPAESCASADGGHATRGGYRIHQRQSITTPRLTERPAKQ